MTKQTISIDSQILNSIQSCERKTKYNFIDNIRPPSKAEALESGDLMHRMLEIFYSLQLDSRDQFLSSEIYQEIKAAGLVPPGQLASNSSYKLFVIQCAPLFASKMDLGIEEVEETIHHFRDYAEYFNNDSWHPLAVEQVGSRIMYDSDDLRVIYNFKIDLVAEQGTNIVPFDHKTARQRKEPSSVSNQFIGYCYGLGVNNIIVNKIGYQKTLSPKERFNRFILTIDDDRIKEWVENTIIWCYRLKTCLETNQWSMDLTSCDKYSGCIYLKLCETSPEGRLYKIERDYKIGESWDVGKKLELITNE